MNAANDIIETREKQGVEESVHYILKYHLGSWTTITDADGNVEQELSYDAWGSLRNPTTWSGDFSGTPVFDRGFTDPNGYLVFATETDGAENLTIDISTLPKSMYLLHVVSLNSDYNNIQKIVLL